MVLVGNHYGLGVHQWNVPLAHLQKFAQVCNTAWDRLVVKTLRLLTRVIKACEQLRDIVRPFDILH